MTSDLLTPSYVERRLPTPPRRRPGRPAWRIVASVVLWLVVVVFGAAYATSLLVPFSYQLQGQRLLIVTSGSMAPVFTAGDVVVLQSVEDESELAVDQVVTFRPVGSQTLVTHRIVELHRLPAMEQDTATGQMVPLLDGNGEQILQPYIVTKGDANDAPDPNATPVSRVRGIVVGYHAGWGRVLQWAQSPVGKAVMLVPPLAALALLEVLALTDGSRQSRAAQKKAQQDAARRLDALLLD
jgi:signal peptidase